MTDTEQIKEKPYFFARILENGRYEYRINTKKASFIELSALLSCLHILEQDLIEHLKSIKPEMSFVETAEGEEGK